jgi:hypothetical protein
MARKLRIQYPGPLGSLRLGLPPYGFFYDLLLIDIPKLLSKIANPNVLTGISLNIHNGFTG